MLLPPGFIPIVFLSLQSQKNIVVSCFKHQKIKEIYTHYAQQEGVEEDRLLFTLHDKTVSPNDTPSSLNIGVASLGKSCNSLS